MPEKRKKLVSSHANAHSLLALTRALTQSHNPLTRSLTFTLSLSHYILSSLSLSSLSLFPFLPFCILLNVIIPDTPQLSYHYHINSVSHQPLRNLISQQSPPGSPNPSHHVRPPTRLSIPTLSHQYRIVRRRILGRSPLQILSGFLS